uniref:Uncharacterized protein n=1 Tax=Rhizophora mucronata TaxID=61149 RepID=A0A2P2KQC4_RHIMU
MESITPKFKTLEEITKTQMRSQLETQNKKRYLQNFGGSVRGKKRCRRIMVEKNLFFFSILGWKRKGEAIYWGRNKCLALWEN